MIVDQQFINSTSTDTHNLSTPENNRGLGLKPSSSNVVNMVSLPHTLWANKKWLLLGTFLFPAVAVFLNTECPTVYTVTCKIKILSIFNPITNDNVYVPSTAQIQQELTQNAIVMELQKRIDDSTSLKNLRNEIHVTSEKGNEGPFLTSIVKVSMEHPDPQKAFLGAEFLISKVIEKYSGSINAAIKNVDKSVSELNEVVISYDNLIDQLRVKIATAEQHAISERKRIDSMKGAPISKKRINKVTADLLISIENDHRIKRESSVIMADIEEKRRPFEQKLLYARKIRANLEAPSAISMQDKLYTTLVNKDNTIWTLGGVLGLFISTIFIIYFTNKNKPQI